MQSQISRRRQLILLFVIAVSPFFFNGYVNSQLGARAALYWSFEILIWVVSPAVCFLIAKQRTGLRLADLGFHASIRGRRSILILIGLSLVVCVLELKIYQGADAFFSGLFPGVALFQYEDMVPQQGALRVLVAFYFALSAGLVEEGLYRGFALHMLGAANHPFFLYLLVSPIVFALVHWESGLANVATAYVLGVLAAATFYWLRNIWPLVAGHIYTDYVLFS